MLLSLTVINSLNLTSSSRARSTTRPSRVEVESTSEPVAEIKSVGVTIAVRNSIVEFSALGSTEKISPAIINSKLDAVRVLRQKSNVMTSEKQTQGTVRVLRHESEILKNNAPGDPHIRDLHVYLPPDYDESVKYPTVYFLSGFTGRGKMFLNDKGFAPNLPERLDLLIAAGRIKPQIAVLPDCLTRYGGSQYINSSATGDYEDYLTREIVPLVDATFSTLENKNSRAVGSSRFYARR